MRISSRSSDRLRLSSGFLLVLSTLGLGAPLSGWAQSTTQETYAPSILTVITLGNQGAIYQSFDQAWLAIKAWYEDPAHRTNSTRYSVTAHSPYIATNNSNPWHKEWCFWIDTYDNVNSTTISSNRCPHFISVPQCAYADSTVNKTGIFEDTYCVAPAKEAQHPGRCPGTEGEDKTGNPIHARNGAKIQTELDYSSAQGLLNFSRTYSSTAGGFLHNWNISFIPPNSTPAQRKYGRTFRYFDYYQNKYIDLVSYWIYLDPTKAAFRTSSGTWYEFLWPGTTPGVGTPVQPYNKDLLTQKTLPDGRTGWVLVRIDEGLIYEFNALGDPLSVTYLSGQKVTPTYSPGPSSIAGQPPGSSYLTALTDPFGRSLSLGYDSHGMLSTLTDPDGGTISYTYAPTDDALSDPFGRTRMPLTVTYQDQSTKKYLWDEPAFSTWTTPNASRGGYLTGIQDEHNSRYATFNYSNGLGISTEHGSGGIDKFTITDQRVPPGSGAGTVSIKDPLGTVRDTQYSLQGGYIRLTSQTQPAGTGCSASTQTLSYDTAGNITSETDFNGNKTCRVIDGSSQQRGLEVMRQEGFAASATCPTSYTFAPLPAAQRRIWTEWHPDWNLPIRRAEPQLVTTWVYNGQPDPTEASRTAWCVQHSDGKTAANAVLLPNGKPLAVLCRKIEQPTTDLQGVQQPSGAKASGNPRRWSYTYNEFGQILTDTDPVDSVTRYEYHPTTTPSVTAGDLMRVTDPVGRTTTYPSYNRRGQPLSIVTSSGLTTSLTYTPRGWVDTVSVAPTAGGPARTTSYSYDKVGQVTLITSPDGASVSSQYDAAHRLITQVDASGNTWTHGYDNAGRLKTLTITDPTGVVVRTQSRVYDALGRVQSETGLR